MANLTLTIDKEILRRARTRAAAEGTSVNAIVREQLEAYAGVREDHRRALESILKIARRSDAGSEGRKWSREELYEERLGRGK